MGKIIFARFDLKNACHFGRIQPVSGPGASERPARGRIVIQNPWLPHHDLYIRTTQHRSGGAGPMPQCMRHPTNDRAHNF
jgi:hypothetical protein